MNCTMNIDLDRLESQFYEYYPHLNNEDEVRKLHRRKKLQEQLQRAQARVELPVLDLKHLLMDIKQDFQKCKDMGLFSTSSEQLELLQTSRLSVSSGDEDNNPLSVVKRNQLLRHEAILSRTKVAQATSELLKKAHKRRSSSIGEYNFKQKTPKTKSDHHSDITSTSLHSSAQSINSSQNSEQLPLTFTICVPKILNQSKYEFSIDLGDIDLTRKVINSNVRDFDGVAHITCHGNGPTLNNIGTATKRKKHAAERSHLLSQQTAVRRENTSEEKTSVVARSINDTLSHLVSEVLTDAPDADETWRAANFIDNINNNVSDNYEERKSIEKEKKRTPKKRGRKLGGKNRPKEKPPSVLQTAANGIAQEQTRKSDLAKYVELFDCELPGGSTTPTGTAVSSSLLSQQLVSSTTQHLDSADQSIICIDGTWANGAPYQLVPTTNITLNSSGNDHEDFNTSTTTFEDIVNYINNSGTDGGNNVIARVLENNIGGTGVGVAFPNLFHNRENIMQLQRRVNYYRTNINNNNSISTNNLQTHHYQQQPVEYQSFIKLTDNTIVANIELQPPVSPIATLTAPSSGPLPPPPAHHSESVLDLSLKSCNFHSTNTGTATGWSSQSNICTIDDSERDDMPIDLSLKSASASRCNHQQIVNNNANHEDDNFIRGLIEANDFNIKRKSGKLLNMERQNLAAITEQQIVNNDDESFKAALDMPLLDLNAPLSSSNAACFGIPTTNECDGRNGGNGSAHVTDAGRSITPVQITATNTNENARNTIQSYSESIQFSDPASKDLFEKLLEMNELENAGSTNNVKLTSNVVVATPRTTPLTTSQAAAASSSMVLLELTEQNVVNKEFMNAAAATDDADDADDDNDNDSLMTSNKSLMSKDKKYCEISSNADNVVVESSVGYYQQNVHVETNNNNNDYTSTIGQTARIYANACNILNNDENIMNHDEIEETDLATIDHNDHSIRNDTSEKLLTPKSSPDSSMSSNDNIITIECQNNFMPTKTSPNSNTSIVNATNEQIKMLQEENAMKTNITSPGKVDRNDDKIEETLTSDNSVAMNEINHGFEAMVLTMKRNTISEDSMEFERNASPLTNYNSILDNNIAKNEIKYDSTTSSLELTSKNPSSSANKFMNNNRTIVEVSPLAMVFLPKNKVSIANNDDIQMSNDGNNVVKLPLPHTTRKSTSESNDNEINVMTDVNIDGVNCLKKNASSSLNVISPNSNGNTSPQLLPLVLTNKNNHTAEVVEVTTAATASENNGGIDREKRDPLESENTLQNSLAISRSQSASSEGDYDECQDTTATANDETPRHKPILAKDNIDENNCNDVEHVEDFLFVDIEDGMRANADEYCRFTNSEPLIDIFKGNAHSDIQDDNDNDDVSDARITIDSNYNNNNKHIIELQLSSEAHINSNSSGGSLSPEFDSEDDRLFGCDNEFIHESKSNEIYNDTNECNNTLEKEPETVNEKQQLMQQVNSKSPDDDRIESGETNTKQMPHLSHSLNAVAEKDNQQLTSPAFSAVNDRELFPNCSVLEFESQLCDNSLDYGDDDADDALSLSTTSCFSSPNDDRFSESKEGDLNQNNTAIENCDGNTEEQPTTSCSTAMDGKFKIPKLKIPQDGAESMASQEPSLHGKSQTPQQSVQMKVISPSITQNMAIAKLFGVTCLPFLAEQCNLTAATCQNSHHLRDPGLLELSLISLPESDLNAAYNFMYNHNMLYRHYFDAFCKFYTKQNNRFKLFNMIYDVQRYPVNCPTFIRIIFGSLLQCGLNKVNACRQILTRCRDESAALINVLVELIMESNWTMFLPSLEHFAQQPHYSFRINVLEKMAPVVLHSKDPQLASVVFKCLLVINTDDLHLMPHSRDLIQLLEMMKNGRVC